MRVRWVGLVIAVSVGAALGLEAVAGSASAAQGAATQRVIVVFRNEDATQPATARWLAARQSSFRSTRAGVVAQMAASGAQSIHSLSIIDAVAAVVSPGELARLRSDRAVQEVVPDGLVQMETPTRPTASAAHGAAPLPGSCAKPGHVQLDPQALQTISAASEVKGAKTARSLGLTGAGVKVAFIADGLDIDDPDFIRRDGRHVFVGYKDFSGYGTSSLTGGGEAFLDASAIAAQGREVYNVSGYTTHALNRSCDIRVEGVAPGASLVGLDVSGPTDDVYDSTFLEAIDYAVTVEHVNVINESLGSNYYPDDQGDLDVIKQANDAAAAAGTVITVSAGDAGPTSTIGTPATDPHVIDAGASTTFRGYAQTGSGGLGIVTGAKGWLNDNLSGLSSAGYDETGGTVDILAPGDLNWALCSRDIALYSDCASLSGVGFPVQLAGGTSQSSPLTAGVAALVIQAYRRTHHGATPSPGLVRRLIISNADDVGMPADEQGAGRLDAYKAALAAENVGRGRSSSRSSTLTLLDSSPQINVVAAPGTRETLRDTVTNESRRAQTLYVRTRTMGAYRTLARASVTLSDSTSRHFTDNTDTVNNYEIYRFRVPAHENRLSVSLAFPASADTQSYVVPQLSLIDPKGRLAANDIAQGDSNFGNSQVTDPTPGRWTALVYAPDSGEGGYVGGVEIAASAARYAGFGTVTPSKVRLDAGASRAVVLRVSTPAAPGDGAGAILISARRGENGSDDAGNQAGPTGVTSIPVTLRSFVPSGTRSFTGTTTGGNGREATTGQTFYYELKVPQRSPELNASVTLPDTPNDVFQAWLVDPSGQSEAYASNIYLAGAFAQNPGPATTLAGAALHVLAPASGRWTLIVAFAPVAAGTQIAQPFGVTTSELQVPSGRGRLPDSAAKQLRRGTTYSYDVTVKNTGPVPAFFFPDARLAGSETLPVAATSAASTAIPLGDSSVVPTYLVPTDSTALTARASTTGSERFQFDVSPAELGYAELGDPDLASTVGTSVEASILGRPVTQGAWDIVPNIHGAFGRHGASSAETVTTSLSVRTRRFDPTVGSRTGDLEAEGVDAVRSLPSFAPVKVAPGQVARIRVTITPSGKAGSTDRGTLYLDEYYDTGFATYVDPVGDQVAAIPYRYRVARDR